MTNKNKPKTNVLPEGVLKVPPEWIERYLNPEEQDKGYESDWVSKRITLYNQILDQLWYSEGEQKKK